MAGLEYKPRGGILLIALFVLALSLPMIAIVGLQYFNVIDMSDDLVRDFRFSAAKMMILFLVLLGAYIFIRIEK